MSRKEIRAISPKIKTETADWLEEKFITLNQGATWCVESLPILIESAVEEAGRVVDINELISLCKGAPIEPNISGLYLKMIAPDQTQGLTRFQMAALEVMGRKKGGKNG